MHRPAGSWSLSDVASILDMLFGESSIGISFHDRDLRFAYVNDTLAGVGGLSAADCIGRRFSDAVSGAAAVVEPYLRAVLDTGAPLLDRPFTDGVRHWLASYYPVRDAGGEVLGVGSVVRDTTEHARTEDLRRQADARYRAFVELCPDPIVIVEESRLVFVNHAAVALMGATAPADLLGRDVWDFLHPDDRDGARAIYSEAMDDGRQRPAEPRLRRLDGTDLVVQVQAALYGGDGPRTMLAVLRDVTQQRAAEQAREQAMAQLDIERTLLQTVLRELPVGVVVFDAGGRFLLANDAASQIWGARLGGRTTPIEEWPLLRTTRGTAVPPQRLRLVQALRGGARADDLALDVLGGDEQPRSLRGSVAPLTAADGTRRGAVATFWDVTALVRAEAELRRARDELEARVAERTARLAETLERLRHEVAERERVEEQLRTAERLTALGTFAAGVAHEINNPFAGILAAAELGRALNADGAERAELDATLARIATEARRGGEIVRSVLRFARSETSERWPGDLNEVVRETCRSARSARIVADSTLHTRLARHLPPILLNRTELEQVLLNLLQNAAQSGAKEIVVRTSRRGDQICLAVRDDGCGIARHHLPRIFDPFFTTREREGGSGLGLSVAHGIVGRHDGVLRVQSRLGVGTTFVVELPVVVAGDSTASAGA